MALLKDGIDVLRALREKGFGELIDISLVVFCLWSLGFVSAFGEGFAKVEDSRFSAQLILESSLLSTRINQCMSIESRTKVFYAEELRRLKGLYLEKVGKDYDEPACSDILDAQP